MTDLIIRWGDVQPGDQALDEARLITVTNVDVRPQEGHPDFLIAYVGGYTEDGRGVSMSPPADWLTAVRRPASSTVTVTTVTGADVLAADEWQRTGRVADDLTVLSGGKLVAEYRPHHWKSAVIDAHRVPDGPDHEARTAGLESLLGEIEAAASDENTTVERLEVIRERLRRYRETGK